MAVVDPTTDTVVIRIVYDGAPFAGKTTSVRALGQSLGGPVCSPGEIGGRTLFFDWLDYTGGLFEGRRIRCQIVSVPGQAVLAPRRRRLLDTADVVVYVLDSSPEAIAAERGYLEGLKATLERRVAPPVGVVVQANKRDVANAIPLAQLREMIDSVGVRAAIVESRASTGLGVRETFVFAVRLALDRVRELLSTGELLVQSPDINDDQQLLADLQRHDPALESLSQQQELTHTRLSDLNRDFLPPHASTGESELLNADASGTKVNAQSTLAASALSEAIAESALPTLATSASSPTVSTSRVEPSPAATQPPMLPDDRVASGCIWPVVVGRTILSELSPDNVQLHRTEEGDWTGSSGGRWRIHSYAHSRYDDFERGRMDLVRWARMHVSAASFVSADRCIVLSKDHEGRSRMWQIFRQEPSLRQILDAAFDHASSASLATLLLASILALSDVQAQSSVTGRRLRPSIDDITIGDVRAKYVGCMPAPNEPHTRSDAHSNVEKTVASDSILAAQFDFTHAALLSRRDELIETLDGSIGSLPPPTRDDTPYDRFAAYNRYLARASSDELDRAVLRLTAWLVEM